MKQLDPKAVWMFFFSYFFAVLFVVLWLGGFSLASLFNGSSLPALATIVMSIVIGLLVVSLISYIIAKLSYRFYRYELRGDCFRKESGIIWKKYVSIPYERIQNVDVHRGIIARLFGLSDLQIQTAGSSAVVTRGLFLSGVSAEGRLPGVSEADAEILRDELIQRAKGARSGGV